MKNENEASVPEFSFLDSWYLSRKVNVMFLVVNVTNDLENDYRSLHGNILH